MSSVLIERQRMRAENKGVFEELVRAEVFGETADPVDVARQLDLMGKTDAEWQHAVALLKQRLAAYQDASRIPELQERKDELTRQTRQAVAEFDALQKQHREMLDPLVEECNSLGAQIMQAERQWQFLRQTYRGPLLAQARAVQQEREKLSVRESELRSALGGVNFRLEIQAQGMWTEETASSNESRRTKLRAAIADVERSIKDYAQRAAQIEQAMHAP